MSMKKFGTAQPIEEEDQSIDKTSSSGWTQADERELAEETED